MNFIVFTVLLICAFAAFVSAGTYNGTVTGSNCGGNCPGKILTIVLPSSISTTEPYLLTSGGCDECPCGTNTNYLDIASWCAQYGGWNQVLIFLKPKQHFTFR